MIEAFLNPIFPVFGVMLLGMVFARLQLFDIVAAQAVNRFVFYVALPALIFHLLSDASFHEVGWQLPCLYFFSELVVIGGGVLLSRFWCRRSAVESLLLGMAAGFVNHVFYILPIATVIYGVDAKTLITVFVVIDTAVVFGGMVVGLEIASNRSGSFGYIVRRLGCNPALLAIAVSLVVNFTNIPVHKGFHTYATFVGQAAPPASLFSLGIIMAANWTSKIDSAALGISSLKIFVFPILAWALLAFASVPHTGFGKTLLLTAAGPCGAMPFVLAIQYRIQSTSIGLAIIYSTVASLFTLAFIA